MILRLILMFFLANSAIAEESDSDNFSDALFAQDEALDPEAAEGDYDERVKAIQKWLWRREAERKIQGLSLEDPKPDDSNIFSSRYFEERGYDEQGFKRLDGNVRVKLRHQPLAEIKTKSHSKKTEPSKASHKDTKSVKSVKETKSLKPTKQTQAQSNKRVQSPGKVKQASPNKIAKPVKTIKSEKPVKNKPPIKPKGKHS